MIPEQLPLPKKPEEIVGGTGWGFLIPVSKERPATDLKDREQEEQGVSAEPSSPPPPQIDH